MTTLIVTLVLLAWFGLGYLGGKAALRDTDMVSLALFITFAGLLGYLVAWGKAPDIMADIHHLSSGNGRAEKLIRRFFGE
jgi:hypothetical protein